MEIGDIGEFGFIDRIIASQQKTNAKGVVGIGDDCAVIPSREGYSYVITTDMLIEGKHFLLEHISPCELGYKSLGVNLSDVVSMGATPLYSFLSISIPPTTTTKWVDEFLKGYNSFNVPLLGGDTTAAETGAMAISVTAIGECKNEDIKYRSGAKCGDYIVTTGFLGSSAAGLKALGSEKNKVLIKAHHAPDIDIKEGIWLGSKKAVTAMMDISDGISSDVRHICKSSKCGAVIDIGKLPIEKECFDFCLHNNLNARELALSGGEDYKLMLTVKKDAFEELNNEFMRIFEKHLFIIGKIEEGNKVRYIDGDREVDIKTGFTHF